MNRDFLMGFGAGRSAGSGGGGGGGGSLVATYSYDEDTQMWSCDKSFEELFNAFSSGSVLAAYDAYDDIVCQLRTIYLMEDGNGGINFTLAAFAPASDYIGFEQTDILHSISPNLGESIHVANDYGEISGYTPGE